ncbi:hypothetical protein H1Q63_13820 [Desmonostoc muscorum CCALA 125]|nr:hypothetical protein [Desmonostoc muscorum CCALA 125]
MSIKLIYHTDTSINGGISPFDQAIHQVSNSEELLIACPYIDISYVEPFLHKCKKWHIVSDIEAWLSAFQGQSRENIIHFIVENKLNIHHYKNLHAKVIVGKHLGLVGSANFTKMGILERVEMSILIEEKENIKELMIWFDKLWNESAEIDIKELKDYAQELVRIQYLHKNPNKALTSKSPTIKAKMRNYDNTDNENSYEDHSQNDSLSIESRVYRNQDFDKNFWNIVKEAEELWSRKVDEFINNDDDSSFFHTLGAAIFVFHLPPRHRNPKIKQILKPPHTAYGKALHYSNIAREVVIFLKSKGIDCFYNPGRDD